MVQLNERQVSILRQLVDGTTERLDKRTLKALCHYGYVNKDFQPTIRAWHYFGLFRWKPQVKIPQKWEVATWKGQWMMVHENPHHDHEPDGWSNANDVQYNIDLFEVMNFYRDICIAHQENIDDQWTESYDRQLERSHDPDYHSYSSWEKHLFLTCRNKAIEKVSDRYNIHYVGDVFYRWANDLYEFGEISHNWKEIITSYKYSFQDNEDEFSKWYSDGLTNDPFCTSYIRVD